MFLSHTTTIVASALPSFLGRVLDQMCWKPCGCGRMWKRVGNKTPGLSTVVVVTQAPFTCGNHYILSAGLKENRPAMSCRSAPDSAAWPSLSAGPSLLLQRGFVIAEPRALSALHSHSLTFCVEEQTQGTRAHTQLSCKDGWHLVKLFHSY